MNYINVTLGHKTSLQSLKVAIANVSWVKMINCTFMPKTIKQISCSMKIFCKFPTVNIPKLIFIGNICIAKDLTWTTLKKILSTYIYIYNKKTFFLFFAPSDSRFSNSCLSTKYIVLYPNKPNINGKLIYSAYLLFINLKNRSLWLVLWSRVTNAFHGITAFDFWRSRCDFLRHFSRYSGLFLNQSPFLTSAWWARDGAMRPNNEVAGGLWLADGL